jgi:hypothetical protein
MSAEDGYFPRGRSILRRVNDERLVGIFYAHAALCGDGSIGPRIEVVERSRAGSTA